MKVWFNDPTQLIRDDKILEFWPTNYQSPVDRLNAASRFIIYLSCILFLIRRDPRIFVLAATMLAVMFVMYKTKMVHESYDGGSNATCQVPTSDNPMANVMITDYTDAPNRLEACYYATNGIESNRFLGDRIPYDSGRSRTSMPQYRRNGFDRQFVSNPVTKIPGDQTAFAEWLYGPKNGPLCRNNPSMCSPDARGVQLEAFAGLGSDGDIRGPRGGGRVRGGGGTYS